MGRPFIQNGDADPHATALGYADIFVGFLRFYACLDMATLGLAAEGTFCKKTGRLLAAGKGDDGDEEQQQQQQTKRTRREVGPALSTMDSAGNVDDEDDHHPHHDQHEQWTTVKGWTPQHLYWSGSMTVIDMFQNGFVDIGNGCEFHEMQCEFQQACRIIDRKRGEPHAAVFEILFDEALPKGYTLLAGMENVLNPPKHAVQPAAYYLWAVATSSDDD